MRPPDHHLRMQRALLSLDGLALGDAFGQRYFVRQAEGLIEARALTPPPWRYTDDTAMALSIVEVLDQAAGIDQNRLARRFADRFATEPDRGYGGMARFILAEIGDGKDWRQVARAVFGGQGSMGNGGAMRAGPIGGYFADDLSAAAEHARLSAEVTHAHPDGQAGAVAAAVAAAVAWQQREAPGPEAARALFAAVLQYTPDSLTRSGIITASELDLTYSVDTAIHALGNGSQVVSYDTVPFCIWCVARHLHSFEEAMWTTVSGLGDRDTTCAIVGSIVALSVGDSGLPAQWLSAREPLRLREGGAA